MIALQSQHKNDLGNNKSLCKAHVPGTKFLGPLACSLLLNLSE